MNNGHKCVTYSFSSVLYFIDFERLMSGSVPTSAVERSRNQNWNAAFCLSGPRTVMHPGSGFVSRTEFVPGSNIKYNTKVQNQKFEANFRGNNTASSIVKARFCSNFVVVAKLC
jgi:hypothetical protein